MKTALACPEPPEPDPAGRPPLLAWVASSTYPGVGALVTHPGPAGFLWGVQVTA